MTTDGKVFGKFNVTRTDGQSEPNRKHDGCDYFVLDTTCDEFALHALRAYIDACKETHPKLAADMERRYRVPRKASDPATGKADETTDATNLERERRDEEVIQVATDIAKEDYNEHPDTKRLRARETKLEAVRDALENQGLTTHQRWELAVQILNEEADDE